MTCLKVLVAGALMLTANLALAIEVKREEQSKAGAPEKVIISGYQKARFGVSLNELKKVYPKLTNLTKNQRMQTAEVIGADIAGKKGAISFSFLDDKLFRVATIHTTTGNEKGALPREFERVQGLLERKYGPPEQVQQENGDVAGADMTDVQLRIGSLVWFAKWKSTDDAASLTLGLIKGVFGIVYEDVKLAAEAKKAIEDQQATDL